MSDVPILTPSECAKLKESWAAAETLNYEAELMDAGVAPGVRRAVTAVVNAAPRMLATIAAHEATIAELKRQVGARGSGGLANWEAK